MGKTIVVASLVLANPMKGVSTHDRPKTTLIVVNNTLVQQWYDELKKAAPTLSIFKIYASSKSLGKRQLKDVDIIVTTPHTKKLPYDPSLTHFHRLIVDESHLMESSASDNRSWNHISHKIIAFKSSYVWAVTGTPISLTAGCMDSMYCQNLLLGNVLKLLTLGESDYVWTRSPDGGADYAKDESGHLIYTRRLPLQAVADQLKRFIIRHTKAQRVNGEQALSLPDADCQTVLLDMSADERIVYEYARCREGGSASALNGGVHMTFDIDALYSKSLKVCAHCYPKQEIDASVVNARSELNLSKNPAAGAYVLRQIEWKYDGRLAQQLERSEFVQQALARLQQTPTSGSETTFMPMLNRLDRMTKMNYLRDELSKLISKEPMARVILFTQYEETVEHLKRTVEALSGWQCLHFDKHTPPTKRHSIIKNFQGGKAAGAQAIVVTYGVAAGTLVHRARALRSVSPPYSL